MSPEVIIYRQYDMKENYKWNIKPYIEQSIIKKFIFLNTSSCFLVHFMIPHQLHELKSKQIRCKEEEEEDGGGEDEEEPVTYSQFFNKNSK
jgi:hypothetical protein